MTKRQRLRSLETRIGRLLGHIRPIITCPIPELSDTQIKRMAESRLDGAIAKRVEWLRANHEKIRMGSGY